MAQSQKTLAGPVEIEGVGLHSGRRVALRILPGEAGSGIVFVRRDLDEAEIPASYRLLNGSNFSTTLSRGQVVVATVELVNTGSVVHGLGALAAGALAAAIVWFVTTLPGLSLRGPRSGLPHYATPQATGFHALRAAR